MMRHPLATSFLGCLAVACGPAGQSPMPAPVRIDYRGPPLRAAYVGDSLRVDVTAQSGGFELRLDDVVRAGADVAVRCTLVTPGAGEATTQALTELSLQVRRTDLATGGASGAVRVEVATIQRGAHYLVPPEHKLAALVPAPR
jgi:hypothetical protein